MTPGVRYQELIAESQRGLTAERARAMAEEMRALALAAARAHDLDLCERAMGRAGFLDRSSAAALARRA